MPFVVATEAHVIPGRGPLSLASGDVVTVGRRDSDWPAFVFVTTAEGSGWVPSRYLSADAGRAVVETPYNTTELATRSGEILEVVDRDDESRVALVSLDRWARGLGSEPQRRGHRSFREPLKRSVGNWIPATSLS